MQRLRNTEPPAFAAAQCQKRRTSQTLTSAKALYLAVAFCLVAAVGLHAQTFNILADFDHQDGDAALALIQGTDGNFYGVAEGSPSEGGAVFRLTPTGTITLLYAFCIQDGCDNGRVPMGLVLGTDGNFYGTTADTGTDISGGTVFKITPSGALTTLYSFCARKNCADGSQPDTALVLSAGGEFYGTTASGGAYNRGTIFKITAEGVLTRLYSFCAQANCADGNVPNGVVQAADGRLYGTTRGGGAYLTGTVFTITGEGALTTLYSFCSQPNCADGVFPTGGLVQAKNGDFYGVTSEWPDPSGTVFKITPAGALTTLYTFCALPNCTDGEGPISLMQATNGDFYGTTIGGGARRRGTIFKINGEGTLTVLHSFHGPPRGEEPSSGLLQATDGNFYGATEYGANNTACGHNVNTCGTIFSVSTNLGPFVKTQPTSGKVGTSVIILGSDLTSATSVTFNGTAAVFSIVSATEITTTVPAGATSGAVEVVAPSGTLSSNVAFAVVP
jgi:uncharacterized repeat protein (TIGR03803 family)